MNITVTAHLTTEEQEIIAAIKRSITCDETVRVNADEFDHLATAEWIETFCQKVGHTDIEENGELCVWGEFHGEEFRILLTTLI